MNFGLQSTFLYTYSLHKLTYLRGRTNFVFNQELTGRVFIVKYLKKS